MASDDHAQVTTVLQRLAHALSMISPLKVGSVVRGVLGEIRRPPPGDPAALRALAEAFRAAAEAARPLESRVRGLRVAPARRNGPPATQVVDATATAVGGIAQAFTAAAAALEQLAGRIEQQQRRHAELHRTLRAAVHDATHVGDTPMADPTALDDLARAAKELIGGCIEVYTAALVAADEAAAVFTDVAARARVGAGVAGGLDAADAVVLAAQEVSIAGIGGGYDDAVLSVGQLRRADSSGAVERLLAAAGSAVERAYLLKAVAAGHDEAGLTAFAEAVRGRDEQWLHHHLSLLDRGGAGSQDRFGAEVDQYDDVTCGTTSAIVARAELDPVYALTFTDGLEPPYDNADRAEFDRRLTAEQRRVHDATNRLWPQRFGTLPGGVAAWLSEHTGVRYEWRPVDDTDERGISRTVRDVVAAVDGGYPVPILVGGAVPRHYVLAVGHDGDSLLIFEPTSGDTRRVPAAAVVGGTLAPSAGFDHVQAVVLPAVR